YDTTRRDLCYIHAEDGMRDRNVTGVQACAVPIFEIQQKTIVSCLRLADEHQLDTIVFCCISTGEFNFPNQRAAEIAIQTVKTYRSEERRVGNEEAPQERPDDRVTQRRRRARDIPR